MIKNFAAMPLQEMKDTYRYLRHLCQVIVQHRDKPSQIYGCTDSIHKADVKEDARAANRRSCYLVSAAAREEMSTL